MGKHWERIIFKSLLTTLMRATTFVVAHSLPEVASSLKPNQHSQVKLVQISDTHGTIGSNRARDGPLSLSPKIISISPFISLTSGRRTEGYLSYGITIFPHQGSISSTCLLAAFTLADHKSAKSCLN